MSLKRKLERLTLSRPGICAIGPGQREADGIDQVEERPARDQVEVDREHSAQQDRGYADSLELEKSFETLNKFQTKVK